MDRQSGLVSPSGPMINRVEIDILRNRESNNNMCSTSANVIDLYMHLHLQVHIQINNTSSQSHVPELSTLVWK